MIKGEWPQFDFFWSELMTEYSEAQGFFYPVDCGENSERPLVFIQSQHDVNSIWAIGVNKAWAKMAWEFFKDWHVMRFKWRTEGCMADFTREMARRGVRISSRDGFPWLKGLYFVDPYMYASGIESYTTQRLDTFPQS